jgi:hypothetical protein
VAHDLSLDKPGFFLAHRELSGAPAADPTTLSDANFPPEDAFGGFRSHSVRAYWTQDGGNMAETVTFEPLIRDGSNQQWVRLSQQTAKQLELIEIPVRGAAQCFLRIHATSATGTDIVVRVTQGELEVTT